MALKKIVLANGLRIVFSDPKPTQSVCVYIRFKAGSRYEAPEKAGVAHLLEHVLLNTATKNFSSAYKLNEFFDTYASGCNGTTTGETLSFYGKSLSTNIKELLFGFSEILVSPLFKPEDIEIEKKRVIEEINWRAGNIASQQMDEFIWDDLDPLGRNPMGTPESVQQLHSQDLLTHYHKYFTPSNIVLGIAGNYDFDSTMILLKEYFSQFERNSIPVDNPPSKFRHPENRVKVIDTGWASASVYMSFLMGIPESHTDYLPILLLSHYLFYGNSSILKDKLLFQKGICYFLDGYNRFFSDTSIHEIETKISFANVGEFIAICILEYRRLQEKLLSEEKLHFLKLQYRNKLLIQSDDIVKLAGDLSYDELHLGSITDINNRIHELTKIKAEDIQRVAQLYFTKEKLRVLVTSRNTIVSEKDLNEIIEAAWNVAL